MAHTPGNAHGEQGAQSWSPPSRAQSAPSEAKDGKQTAPGGVSMEQFREMLAKAPPGALKLGTPVDAATFQAMRAKQGLTSKPIKINSQGRGRPPADS